MLTLFIFLHISVWKKEGKGNRYIKGVSQRSTCLQFVGASHVRTCQLPLRAHKDSCWALSSEGFGMGLRI
jgi:hypothetical protein